MSDYNITGAISGTKNNAPLNRSYSAGVTMAGNELSYGTQLIPTTWTALTWGSITGTPGAAFIHNLDATNYVQLALANDNSGIFARLKADEVSVIKFEPGITIYAKANTASVRIEKAAAEA